jgi:hypothetical protein
MLGAAADKSDSADARILDVRHTAIRQWSFKINEPCASLQSVPSLADFYYAAAENSNVT